MLKFLQKEEYTPLIRPSNANNLLKRHISSKITKIHLGQLHNNAQTYLYTDERGMCVYQSTPAMMQTYRPYQPYSRGAQSTP